LAAEKTQALTPAQVNSWPVSTKGLTLRGEKLYPSPALENKDEAFLELARERFKLCSDAEDRRRAEMLADLNFRAGIQWDEAVKQKRLRKKRPCHTVNRIPEFVKHVVNNMRQARPAIKIDPVGDGADQEQAEIRQGLIQYIERNSQAETAYDTAMENMCTMGLGWIRVIDDWAAHDSFDKDLFIRWVLNTFSVYSDPTAQMPDWSDMKYAFVVNDLMMSEFRAQFGDKPMAADATNFSSIGDHQSYWFPRGNIRVAEYFWIEQKADTLCELEDGSTRLLSDLPKPNGEPMYKSVDNRLILINRDEVDEDGWAKEEDIGRTRPCFVPVVHWALITGTDKLRERKWEGRFIPLIPVIGNQIELDGDRMLVGMVRYARELQQMYNYIVSCISETIGLAPRAQWLAEIDQIEQFREAYEAANNDPQVVLPYKKQSIEGVPVPPPQRISMMIEVAGLVQALQVIDAQMKSVFSIYDASLGQKGPQESGKAIDARRIESDTSTYDWGDNFIRSLEHTGRVINDLLKPYYNTPGRIVQILREDQSRDAITLNQEYKDPKTGEPRNYDLSKGKYSVVISTGPSHQTKRQQASSSMLELAKMYPPVMQVAGDIIVKEMDWPGKEAIAARLEKTLPPGLKDPDPNAPPIPQEAQAAMGKMQALIQQLSAALHEATDKNNLQLMKEQFQTFRDSMKNEVTLAVAELTNKSEQAMFMSDKIFEHLEFLRNYLQEKELNPPDPSIQSGQPQAGPSAPQGAPPPVLAGPPTASGQPSSVGGV
jgi:hypothetical protein